MRTQRTGEDMTQPAWAPGVAAAAAVLVAALLVLALGAPQAGALGLGDAPDVATARHALQVDAATADAMAAEAQDAAGLGVREGSRTRADALRAAAREAQATRLFTRAHTLYGRARDLYLQAGARRPARACLTAMQDIYLIVGTYGATRSEMLEELETWYPGVPAARRAAWLDMPSTESLRWDGVKHYFYDVPVNLAYRDLDLFLTLPSHVAAYQRIYDGLVPYLAVGAATPAWQQYGEPHAYDFTQTLSVPRAALAATGDLRAWLPVPIVVGPQSDVRIGEITPTTWLEYPPSITQDIGLVYLHVPLGELNDDLDLTFGVHYTHAAQYFKVRPAAIGAYDTSSASYRRYTASRGNTTFTPSMRRTALRVAGSATNPYYAARRLYRYILAEVKYSHVPHVTMWPRGQAESVYVHQHKYGDCGAQSMYFAALCRSIGIPARTTGGFQTFTGKPDGHFWAEVFLPDYGWIPADPAAATMADYLPSVTPAERQAFHDFYFGSQDDQRLVVQKDVDLPLIPRADMRVQLPMAVQMPAATCETMTDMPGFVLTEYWTFK
jgi:transglutaminase-like putative cysteine protease